MQKTNSFFALCTILFVFFMIRTHVGSNAYACAAVAQILMSIPVTAFLYRIVFRIEYFGTLHLCSIFLALGIGADDNFVLFDAWRQAQTDIPAADNTNETTLRRLLYAFARTMDAVFSTSLTTALAFLCMALSPIMPVRTFGIFAAMIVVCNYVMVLTLVPTCMILCEGCHSRPPYIKGRSTGSACGLPSLGSIFERCYLPAMTWNPSPIKRAPVGAWLSVCCFLALGMFLGYRVSHLEMPRTQDSFLPKKHMMTSLLEDMANDYESSTDNEYCEVFYTFGIDNLGKENYNEYEPDFKRGYAKWSGSFSLDTAAVRTALMEFCDAVRTAPCTEHD